MARCAHDVDASMGCPVCDFLRKTGQPVPPSQAELNERYYAAKAGAAGSPDLGSYADELEHENAELKARVERLRGMGREEHGSLIRTLLRSVGL